MPSPHTIDDLRAHLFGTLSALRSKDDPMEVDRARAVVDVARVLVESAKVEVDFLKVTGAVKATNFLPDEPTPAASPRGLLEPMGIAATPEIAKRRDTALVERLDRGPASFADLLMAMPDEGLSERAREAACTSSLHRLKAKNLVMIVPEGWAKA